MPDEPTKLRRARLEAGWSQPQLIAAMRRLAPTVKLRLPDSESMKTNIRRWENGQITPGPEYRPLLRAVYGMTDSELGFPPSPDGGLIVIPAADLSTEALAYFDALLIEHVRADNLIGPHLVIDQVEQQAHRLNVAARDARGELRHELTKEASRFMEFLGWLKQDAGHYVEAMAATDRACDLAMEAPDPLWNSYLLMRKSNIATDADDPAIGAALADAALRVAPSSAHRVHAVILRQKANAHAALGELDLCAAAVDESFNDVDHDAAEGDQIAAYCTTPYVAMEAADCWTRLGRPDRALAMFEQAGDWPEALRRDKGLSLARIATARAAAGDVAIACSIGTDAITIANATKSVRTIHALRRLRVELDQWRSKPEVQAVSSAVASLVSTAA